MKEATGTFPKLISREELLGGGVRGKLIKQANTLLVLIRNRTAHLVAQSQQPAGIILSETAVEAGNRVFLEAIAQGRELPVRPTIRDLERFAPQWAILVPENPDIRATAAWLLAEKYDFTRQATPGIRMALGLDTPAVQQIYQNLYNAPLEAIYTPRVGLADRLRWQWSALSKKLDALPPFWIALMVTLVIGGVTLALPIAVAGIGALPGIALIIVLGLVNIITISAMAETVARSGNIRYGNAFIGRVVTDYLDSTSSAILSIVMTAFSFGLLLIFYLGISTTLEGSTGLPAEIWMVLLFLVSLYFLSRGSLNTTIAFTLVIGIVNLSLLLVLAILAFTQFNPDNLLYMNIPLLNGQPFDPSLLSAVIGVALGLYSAHIMVVVFGKMMLRRDPGGGSVMRGHVAGIAVAMVINSVWVLAVNGAIDPQVLASQSGTVLVPLAAQLGPVAGAVGAAFAILSMGMGLIHFSIAIFNLAKERLNPQRAMALGRQGSFLVSLSPVIVVFLTALWLSLTNSGSFTGILGFLGVIVDSLMAGIFPVLLLAASRRKGELVPNVVYRFLGNRALLTGIYLLFLFNLFFHGLVIWQNPIQRAGGVLVGLAMLGVTINLIRRGIFTPRMAVEVREDQCEPNQSRLSITANGRPLTAEMQLMYEDGNRQIQNSSNGAIPFSRLQSFSLQLPPSQAKELKVWAYRVTPEENIEDLPVMGAVHNGDKKQEFNLALSGGQVILPLTGETNQLEIIL